MSKQKKSQGRGVVWWIIMIIAVAVFIFAAYQLITIFLEYKKADDEYDNLKQYVTIPSGGTEKDSAETDPEDPDPGPDVDFDALVGVNEDVIGWLEVEALDISYPIVQGTDNDYYLHRTVQRTYNFAGSIFLEYENKPDFSDCNSIVYGHNMKNGSMFGTLKRFRDKATYDQSRYFWICTPAKNYKYEIFAAAEVAVGSEAYTLFSGPGELFEEYLKNMKAQSQLDTDDIELTGQDKVVTLSTCTGNDSTRYIVQGKRIN